MKLRPVFHALAALASVSALAAAEQMLVTVTHDLTIARPSETIVVPWSQVNAALPGALLQRIAVKDATGRVLPYQVTNVAPQAKDPKGVGIALMDLRSLLPSFPASLKKCSLPAASTFGASA